MSQDQQSLPQSQKEQLEFMDNILNEYEKSHKIQFTAPNDIDKYLNLELEQLRKMSPVDIAEVSYLLSRFSGYVQKQYNIEMVRMNWAEHQIKKVITGQLHQYKAPSYEERKQLAIMDNEAARKLDEIRNYAKLRAERVAFISTKLNDMSRSLIDLQKARRGND